MRRSLACLSLSVCLVACDTPSFEGPGSGGGGTPASEESGRDPVFQNLLSVVLPASVGLSFACTFGDEAVALRFLPNGQLEASAFEETHEGTWSPTEAALTLSVPTLSLVEESLRHQLAFDLLVSFESVRLRCGAVSTKTAAPSWAIATCPKIDTAGGALDQGFAFGTDGGVIWRRIIDGKLADCSGVYRTQGKRAFLAFPGLERADTLTGTLLDDGISFDALENARRTCKTPAAPAQ